MWVPGVSIPKVPRVTRQDYVESSAQGRGQLTPSHSLFLGSGPPPFFELHHPQPWVGAGPSGRLRFRPIGSCPSAEPTGQVARAARGLDFCFVILTPAVHPPTESGAWLPGATGNPPLFTLSWLPSGLAAAREVRDAAGPGELVFSSDLFT